MYPEIATTLTKSLWSEAMFNVEYPPQEWPTTDILYSFNSSMFFNDVIASFKSTSDWQNPPIFSPFESTQPVWSY